MNKIKEEFKKIDDQINPSKEFTLNLKDSIMKKIEERKKKKQYAKRILAVACIMIILFSGGVFVDGFENIFSKMFSSINKGIETAINNNYIQNVNTKYVKHNGIAIKVDNILIDDNNLVITFNIKTDKEIDIIDITKMYIADGKGNIIYDSNYETYDNDLKYSIGFTEMQEELISNKEAMKICTINLVSDAYKEITDISINISEVFTKKGEFEKHTSGDWKFKLNVDDKIFYRDKIEYEMVKSDLTEEYSIYLTNTELNVDFKFKEEFDSINEIKARNKITIEDKKGNIYYANDNKGISNSILRLNFPINKFYIFEELKLKIYLQDSVLEFNLRKK